MFFAPSAKTIRNIKPITGIENKISYPKQEAIINNVKYIKDKTGAKIIAVVKENGYGLGVANLYHILQDQDIFMYAVTAPCEAIALRKEGCTEDILMLTPISDFSELVTMVSLGVVIALGSEDQIPELLDVYKLVGKKPRVHIQIDSGLGRYGFNADDMLDFSKFKDCISIEGCFSHLAGSIHNYKKSVENQVRVFELALEKIKASGVEPGICHIANSKAAMTFGSLGYEAVRVGSAILGKVADNNEPPKLCMQKLPNAGHSSLMKKPLYFTEGSFDTMQ